MHAVEITQFGGPEVLKPVERPTPATPLAGSGEVLIRVHAAGINPPDWYLREGMKDLPPEWRPAIALPAIPGTDVSGVIEAVAPGAGLLPYFGCLETTFGGHRLVVARTGYTGERGYEVFGPSAIARDLWDAVLAADARQRAGRQRDAERHQAVGRLLRHIGLLLLAAGQVAGVVLQALDRHRDDRSRHQQGEPE